MNLREWIREFEMPAPNPLNEPVPAVVPTEPAPAKQPAEEPLVPA
jgi:hypothetical protein